MSWKKLRVLDNVEIVGVFVETITTPTRGFFDELRRSIKYDGLVGTVAKLSN
ncbi:MAG: hypothetical protein ABIU09_06630 [Pyrinomonadaceae bacterium]